MPLIAREGKTTLKNFFKRKRFRDVTQRPRNMAVGACVARLLRRSKNIFKNTLVFYVPLEGFGQWGFT